jgi:predicted Zn finger-like uncharacterized protein
MRGLAMLVRGMGISPDATVCVKAGLQVLSTVTVRDVSLSGARPGCENAQVVAQCPSCQSRFRIADEKVTERGVRVRCSSCKTVFQVSRPGSDEPANPADLAGTTLDLQGFETGRIPTGKVKAAPAQGRKPTTAPLAGPGAAAAKVAAQSARTLDSDDLFGMDELTGKAAPKAGSPLAAPSTPESPRRGKAQPSVAKEPAAESFSFDDLEAGAPPAAAPEPERRVRTGRTAPVLPRTEKPGQGAGDESDGARSTEPAKDSFGDLELDRPAAENPLELSTSAASQSPAPTSTPERRAEPRPEARAESREAPAAPRGKAPRAGRAVAASDAPARTTRGEIAASALTGVVAAAATLVVLLVVGASGRGNEAFRKATGGGDDVVATHVASGLYDTSSGVPVFFVRGRVENHGDVARGPIRVIAELVAEGGVSKARAEALAGIVPSPEDVYALRTAAEVDKFARSLALGTAKDRIPAGASLPFLALIAEPPPDLNAHQLRVRVEAHDAGSPPPRTALKPPR